MTTVTDQANAIEAMEDRGIEGAEKYLHYAEPQAIFGACEWWDRQPSAGPALLVWKIKQGGIVPASEVVPPLRRPTYSERLLPIFYMTHREWDRRREYQENCPTGRLMIAAASYPVLEVECDACGFLAGLPHRKVPPHILEQLERTP